MTAKRLFCLVAALSFAFSFGFVGCDNSSGNPPVVVSGGSSTDNSGGSQPAPTNGTDNGGGQTENPTGTDNGGNETPSTDSANTPEPEVTYTVLLYYGPGSSTVAFQTFTKGVPQALKTIEELGFEPPADYLYFAGWLTSSVAREVSYADGASYTATASACLYAKWSDIPRYSVKVPVNEHGSVTATPATAREGTPITLSATPFIGYEFSSYTVTTVNGSNAVDVVDGKFKMPNDDVTVSAVFSAINYNIVRSAFVNGTVNASASTATFGSTVSLEIVPNHGYKLESISVTAGGDSVALSGEGNSRTFSMPASDVKIAATFMQIKYEVTCGPFVNGTVSADLEIAPEDATVTLTVKPDNGFKLSALSVTAGGSSVPVSGDGNTRTFSMPEQAVTVSASFVVIAVASGEYTPLPAGTDGTLGTSGSYVTFGLWPQSRKKDGVTIDENETKSVGFFTYCKGSDGEWYASVKEMKKIALVESSSSTWLKVEPIKWRVLTSDFNGKKLLFAENVLAECKFYEYGSKHNSPSEGPVLRKIDESVIYPNNYEHSRVRAFLNGLSYQVKESRDAQQTTNNVFLNKGFFQTAFTESERGLIEDTDLYDVEDSTTDATKTLPKAARKFISAYTKNKVFLLSQKEATMSEYGFDAYDVGDDTKRSDWNSAREREYKLNGNCWHWILRSPISSFEDSYKDDYGSNGDYVQCVQFGKTGVYDTAYFKKVACYAAVTNTPECGVVPALCVSK